MTEALNLQPAALQPWLLNWLHSQDSCTRLMMHELLWPRCCMLSPSFHRPHSIATLSPAPALALAFNPRPSSSLSSSPHAFLSYTNLPLSAHLPSSQQRHLLWQGSIHFAYSCPYFVSQHIGPLFDKLGLRPKTKLTYGGQVAQAHITTPLNNQATEAAAATTSSPSQTHLTPFPLASYCLSLASPSLLTPSSLASHSPLTPSRIFLITPFNPAHFPFTCLPLLYRHSSVHWYTHKPVLAHSFI